MKQFVFKQAALLGKGKAGDKNSVGTTYHRGIHVVPDKHQEDPTFKHFAKHGLIEPYVPKAQGKLKPAESDIAKVSMDAAKSQLEPDAEIGGESEEEDKGHNRKVRRK